MNKEAQSNFRRTTASPGPRRPVDARAPHPSTITRSLSPEDAIVLRGTPERPAFVPPLNVAAAVALTAEPAVVPDAAAVRSPEKNDKSQQKLVSKPTLDIGKAKQSEATKARRAFDPGPRHPRSSRL